MRDILTDVDAWLAKGTEVALATVVSTWGSSPRGVGATMAVASDGRMAGSVSGGCVEGAVAEAALEVLTGGQPAMLHFSVADPQSWAVGLSCGGSIDVFVHRLHEPVYRAFRHALRSEAALLRVLVTEPSHALASRTLLFTEAGNCLWSDLSAEDSAGVFEQARHFLAGSPSGPAEVLVSGERVTALVEAIAPSPSLVCVGGVQIAIALTKIAKALGHTTTVVDPRRTFGSRERFPHVDRLIQEWPDEAFELLDITSNTAIAVLTHDPKIDNLALKVALKSPAFYVGALGKSSTQAQRRRALLRDGVAAEDLARIHGPIGVNLGGKSPEEIALAIMAEIVAARHGTLSPAGGGGLRSRGGAETEIAPGVCCGRGSA